MPVDAMPHPTDATHRAATASTLLYYAIRADTYITTTADTDLARAYAPFVALLPPNAKILDAGCGSGRDTLALRALGFRVAAMDACAAIARRAEERLKTEVLVLRHEEVDFVGRFHGVWASASLLHVPRAALGDVFQRYARALVPRGVLACSFKRGTRDERTADGRWFTDFTADTFRDFLAREAPQFALRTLIEEPDADRPDTTWLRAVCQRRT